MGKSTILHLRIPFSFFLLPIFLFAVAVGQPTNALHTALVFFILHFLVYPASNGFNSYFDKDEESIGGLKNPPKVTMELYWVSLIMDGLAMLLGLLISVEFVIMVLIYGLISKAYSHPIVRLKRYAVIGWLAAGIFQGYFTFLMVLVGTGLELSSTFSGSMQVPAILSSMFLLGSYPMTQVYQHDEDGRRGDHTISRMLGILGTFHFTAIFFTITMAGFGAYFYSFQSIQHGIGFFLFTLPILLFFLYWYLKVTKDMTQANFKYTMRLNFISSVFLNLFFVLWWLSDQSLS
ncbi:MAG: UbiA prenyltransferase family protein [Cyclobacteriaceae bacterium]|nr:UbiA prenyltransferase family protein [Cyclobacteriaceae bacterium HetDA_MAG_MS6]